MSKAIDKPRDPISPPFVNDKPDIIDDRDPDSEDRVNNLKDETDFLKTYYQETDEAVRQQMYNDRYGF